MTKGFGVLESEEGLMRTLNHKRHIEERTSLLTNEYQRDKYADDYFMNNGADSESYLDDPTAICSREN
jgi:hypothetical protein